MQGIKLGDFQATVSAFINAGLFFVVSQAKPLETLSPERPHPNIFCAYVFLSMLGQFALHTSFLIFVYNGAVRVMPEVSQPLQRVSPFRESAPSGTLHVWQITCRPACQAHDCRDCVPARGKDEDLLMSDRLAAIHARTAA